MFVGYGSMQYSSVFPLDPVPEIYNASGFRLGTDVRADVGSGFAAVGGVAWYPSATARFTQTGVDLSDRGTALDWYAAVQYALQNWTFEGGYRGAGFTVPLASPCGGATCGVRWSGWYLGVGYRF